MIYALAVSVAFSTMALVTLALLELAQGLRRRSKALDVALRLHAELGRQLDVLRASHVPPPRVGRATGLAGSRSRARRCGIDRIGDRHAHRIQSLRERLERLDVRIDAADEHHLERLHRNLSDLATEVELLAAEVQVRAVIGARTMEPSPAARPVRDDRRVA